MAAGAVGSAGVGIVVRQIVRDRVDDALRDLRSAGAVEKDGGMAVHRLREGRELGADAGEVEGGSGELVGGRHRVLSILIIVQGLGRDALQWGSALEATHCALRAQPRTEASGATQPFL